MRIPLSLGVILLLAAGWGTIATSSDEDSPSEPPVAAQVRTDRPLDPEGPWAVGTYRLQVSALDQRLELVAPLVAKADRGPVDRVLVVDPSGRPLAGVACEDGRCRVSTPLGTRRVPAATLWLEGAWQSGRVTSVKLQAGGETVGRVDPVGTHGVRVTGRALGEPVTVTTGLVFEGSARDVDRLALRDPDGRVVLEVEPGGGDPGRVTVAGERFVAPDARVEVVGDPLTDESVTVRLWTGDERLGLVVHQTPAEAFGRAGRALSEHLVLRSPTRAREANLTLAAGPVTLSGDGRVSPRFDARLSLSVEDASGYDRAWLLVDGAPRTRLDVSGVRGGERMLHGRLPDGALSPGVHEVSARLERDLAPGVVQTSRVPAIDVVVDDRGPAPPVALEVDDGILSWPGDDSVVAYEVEARLPSGRPASLPVNGTSATLPGTPEGAWSARVRGVDELGNPGPWSREVSWTVGGAQRERVPARPFSLEAPGEHAVLSGVHEVRWRGSSVARIEVEVRAIDDVSWTPVAQGSTSPLSWDTRTVPDGAYRLRVTALGTDGATTRLVPVRVDNLDTAVQRGGGSLFAPAEPAGGSGGLPDPLPGRPLPTAVTVGLGVLGTAALAGVHLARARRDGKR